MDRARTDNDQEAIVVAGEDLGCTVACRGNCALCVLAGRDLVAQQGGLNKRIVLDGSATSTTATKDIHQ